MPEHAPDAPLPHHIVVMGVSGSGKTTVGTELANLMGLVYLDGDDFHPQANIDKMASGIPLDDADRWPWLRRVGNWLAEQEHGAIVACSALKHSYREILLSECPGTVFVHCTGSRELLEQRMLERTKHFMPAHLLDSQLATLEPLRGDEPGASFDVAAPPTLVAEAMKDWITAR